ncbi:MAG: fimbrillin family protein [Muribaculaceae bacterium]|nr:fimbrillin family protein [Muribaculaceae bacterium]
MTKNIFISLSVTLLTVGLCACSQDYPENSQEADNSKMKMAFTFSHPSQSRATETSFLKGDKVGMYVAESALPLEIAGNLVNNAMFTFDGNNWNTTRQLYWDAGEYNAYAYYPYQNEITSISDMPFSVSTDQSLPAQGETLSAYEQSDFLYANALKLTPSSNPVNMTFSHILSKLTVRLVKGEDYEGEIPEEATVLIHNTVPDATIDMAAGVATKAPKATSRTITACRVNSTNYTAILVPQRLDNRVPLIEIIANGVSFMYESKFLFKPGVHHLVTLVLDKNPEQLKIEIGGEIAGWN